MPFSKKLGLREVKLGGHTVMREQDWYLDLDQMASGCP